ncbi:MAG: murein L,D-transpeptidase catalytic domain family protein [bacterium]|jgi:hypothetical protein
MQILPTIVKKKLFAAITLLIITTTAALSFTAIGKSNAPTNSSSKSKIVPERSGLEHLAYCIYQELCLSGIEINEELFGMAFKGFTKLSAGGRLNTDSILTIIDFSRSSKEKRMFVIDLKEKKLLFNTVVAHGRNTGEEYARSFSNTMNSHQSSLGFYVTMSPYNGSNGYSLALDGIEKGINDNAFSRAIVMHGAEYANESMINIKGYLGRSFGCPALPTGVNKKVIDKIKEGSCIFIYYPDKEYLSKSEILNG